MAPRKKLSADTSSPSSSSSACSKYDSSSLELASSAHAIAKQQKQQRKQPIVRVVHVFAPKLIKTEAANFRALVQKLTGNKASRHDFRQEFEAHENDNNSVINGLQDSQGTDNVLHEAVISPNYSANYVLSEEIRVVESSRPAALSRKMKNPIDSLPSSASSALNSNNVEDPLSPNEFSARTGRESARINDSDTELTTPFHDYDEGINPTDFFDLANASDGAMDYFAAANNACDDDDADEDGIYERLKELSSTASSSTSWFCNTESRASGKRGVFDEVMEMSLGSFNFNGAPHHLVQPFGDTSFINQLLLNPAL